jgi:hypothetical protein
MGGIVTRFSLHRDWLLSEVRGDMSALDKIRWPMPFTLGDCDASLVGNATHELAFHWDFKQPPDVVHRTFLGFMGDEHWAPGFIHLGWHTPEGELRDAVMDEFYWFMAMQIRVIDHTPGRRSVLRVERWSLPLATKMIQILETEPASNGGTHLTMRVAYNVPLIFRPLHPPVAAVFSRWFKSSFRGLDRYLQKTARA